ncbi:SPOR domain-containing protein [Sphingomonas sp.]|uniref:SPOR domain-containing protein n=1 Tax=Sphingomonas sp. TaxID=28214 RepID=UPI001D76DCC1|nr:SPOR domain-containing protein [Sphingomonas sp.]MBX9797071.1 SPOR domain-containing protein [Sphingomonas sp.]
MATVSEALADEDRLPWLETVDEDYDDRPSFGRIMLFVLGGLAVIAGLIFAAYSVQRQAARPAEGGGELIAAPAGDYKVKPDSPGGVKVAGEGDAAMATSQGKGPTKGKIDLKQMSEAPLVMPGKGVMPGAAGGSVVQLGSFPTQSAAMGAWTRQSKRFAYLAGLGHQVLQAQVGGATFYRLRVNAGSASAATELCAKLKLAGEPCFIARQ